MTRSRATDPRSPELVLASDLRLPISTVTEKIAFIGRTGGGKTYASQKLAEQMLLAGAQIIAIDPVGKWYGLRVAGTGSGFSIPVFGGQHGDYPLTSNAGKLVADLIVDRRISAVLDISDFLTLDAIRFCTDFAMQFFQRKKKKQTPVHIFIEECQEVVPQVLTDKGAPEMLQAWQRIWKIGRNYGIGGSLIGQRPQEINKRVLNQTGTLFVFGMTSPHERNVVENWLSDQDSDDDISDILPKLLNGEAHLWSPGFLKLSREARVDAKQTADISATPTHGDADESLPLTHIDASALREQMLELIEQAESNDPKTLRRRISDLQSECERLERTQKVTEVEKPVLTAEDWQRIDAATDTMKWAVLKLYNAREAFFSGNGAMPSQDRPEKPIQDRILKNLEPRLVPRHELPQTAGQEAPVVEIEGKRLDQCERRILQVLSRAPEGARGLTLRPLATRAGYSNTGSFRTALSRIRTLGLIEGKNTERMTLSQAGAAVVTPDPDYPYSTLDYWKGKLLAGERTILDVLSYRANRHGLKLAALAEACGVTKSGTFRTYLSSLRTKGLIEGENTGTISLSPEVITDAR